MNKAVSVKSPKYDKVISFVYIRAVVVVIGMVVGIITTYVISTYYH